MRASVSKDELMKATIRFLHKHAGNWQRQCVVGLGCLVDAGTRMEPSEVLKHEEKNNCMTSGEGSTMQVLRPRCGKNEFLSCVDESRPMWQDFRPVTNVAPEAMNDVKCSDLCDSGHAKPDGTLTSLV